MNNNALAGLQYSSVEELLNAMGVAQFPGADNFYITISGILIQAGVTGSIPASGTVAVPYNVGYPQRCMGVILTPRSAAGSAAANPGQNSFTLVNGSVANQYTWLAWGT